MSSGASAASAASAVVHVHDGGLVLDEEERAPLRRVELAAIWRAEAEAELQDAIVAARDAGESFDAIGGMLGMSGEAVRVRYGKAKQRRIGGSSV